MRFLVLLTDGFGGHGGIAKFNRDLLKALCSHPNVTEVMAIPRLQPGATGPLPSKLNYVTSGLNSKNRFILATLRTAFKTPAFDLILCAHINLLPIAFLARAPRGIGWGERTREPSSCSEKPGSSVASPHQVGPTKAHSARVRPPIALVVHGIDAWEPTRSRIANYCARKVDAFIAVSEITKERFLKWTKLDATKGRVLPNCIDLAQFQPGPVSAALRDRYQLRGRKVIMILARLSADERYKGIDEVLEVLPELAKQVPNISYLIVGDGTDRSRLEEKAVRLGIKERVVFAGRIAEEAKQDHYRLADAFVMSGWGEGFGIVYLEAMACGIPVLASKLDASREALRNGQLGILVDPKNPGELRAGILEVLQREKGKVQSGLEYFSSDNFRARAHELIEKMLKTEKRKW